MTDAKKEKIRGRLCTKCGERKHVEEFNSCQYLCRQCHSEYNKKYYRENKGGIKKQRRVHKESYEDKIRQDERRRVLGEIEEFYMTDGAMIWSEDANELRARLESKLSELKEEKDD